MRKWSDPIKLTIEEGLNDCHIQKNIYMNYSIHACILWMFKTSIVSWTMRRQKSKTFWRIHKFLPINLLFITKAFILTKLKIKQKTQVNPNQSPNQRLLSWKTLQMSKAEFCKVNPKPQSPLGTHPDFGGVEVSTAKYVVIHDVLLDFVQDADRRHLENLLCKVWYQSLNINFQTNFNLILYFQLLFLHCIQRWYTYTFS